MKSSLKVFLLLAFSLAAACGSGNEPSSSLPDPSQIDVGVDWMTNFNQSFAQNNLGNATDCSSFLNLAELVPAETSCDQGNFETENFVIDCENFSAGGTAAFNFTFNDCRSGADTIDGKMSAYYNYDGLEFSIHFGVGIGLVVNGVDFKAQEISMHYSDIYMRYFCDGVFYPEDQACDFLEDCSSCTLSTSF